MAKKEKVSKGFGFYLIMFVMLLVVAFMIFVMILMFSPKKVILGVQYFYYNDTYEIPLTEEGDEVEKYFSNFQDIVVDCGSSNVSVIKSDRVKKDSIIIKNRVIGFAKGSDNVNFDKTVSMDGTKITVKVQEPNGFLFFLKDTEITFVSPMSSEEDFSGCRFDITTTSGNVSIGTKTGKEVNINDLTVKTGSGSVTLLAQNDNAFNKLSILTKSGNFSTALDTILVDTETTFTTNSGTIRFNKFSYTEGFESDRVASFNLGNGRLIADEICSLSVTAKDATVDINKLHGNFSTIESIDYLNKSNFVLDEVSGSVTIPSAKASNITIGRVDGSVYIGTTSGNISVGKTSGIKKSSRLSTTSGRINAYLDQADSSAENHFSTDNGTVNLYYQRNINTKNIVKSKTGNVNFELYAGSKFILSLFDADGNPYRELTSKIYLPFVDKDRDNPYKFDESANGYRVSGYTGRDYRLAIYTNGRISGDYQKII